MDTDEVKPKYPIRECALADCRKKFWPTRPDQTHHSIKCTQRDAMLRFRAKRKKNQPPPGKPPTRTKSRRGESAGQVVMFTSPAGEGQSGSSKERAAA